MKFLMAVKIHHVVFWAGLTDGYQSLVETQSLRVALFP
jgi:hypothetical protein